MKFITRKKFWLYLIAILAGLVGGSLPYLHSLFGADTDNSQRPTARITRDNPESIQVPGGSQSNQPDRSEDAGANGEDRLGVDDENLVFAGKGVVLRPAYLQRVFVGYEVIRSDSDSRFSPGDIISQVNGERVENSAAGGELMIVGLNNPGAEIVFAEKN